MRFTPVTFIALFGLCLSTVQVPVACLAAPQNAVAGPSAKRALFVDMVWKVRVSKQVAPGQLYVFLSEGTLVIASPKSKPAFGSWTYKNGVLTLTEEGRPYRADIVKLTRTEFRLKIRNPGTPVEMTLIPARGV